MLGPVGHFAIGHCPIAPEVTCGLHVTFALLAVKRGFGGVAARYRHCHGSGTLDTPYRGGFLGHEHRFALSVYFEDTDAYGIVYYANYLKFMERARSDMIRAVGVDQAAELRRSGSAYAVVEVDIKYRRPAGSATTFWSSALSNRSAHPRSIFISKSCAGRNC